MFKVLIVLALSAPGVVHAKVKRQTRWNVFCDTYLVMTGGSFATEYHGATEVTKLADLRKAGAAATQLADWGLYDSDVLARLRYLHQVLESSANPLVQHARRQYEPFTRLLNP